MKRAISSLLLAGLPVLTAQASDLLPDRATVDHFLSGLGGDNAFDKSKTIDWGVLPGPFYTPELGLGLGTAIVGLYRPDPNDSVSQNSSLALKGFFSTTGTFGVGFENYSFFAGDKWRLFINGAMKNMSTYYWGNGYQAGHNDAGKAEYTDQAFSLTPRVMYRIAEATYLGLGWDIKTSHATNIEEGKQALFDAQPAGRSILTSGVSALLSYDTRDFVPNARVGQAINLTYTYYDPVLGSDNRFQTMKMQYNVYHSLSDSQVLGLDLYSIVSGGDVPWDRLALLGSDKQMRGYYEGRYRDRNVFSAQVEYRQKLDWRNGVVLWLGTGTLNEKPADLLGGHWLPSVGVGYRFEFKPRMNVRFDFGVGQGSSGFYFQVGEAF